MYWYNGYDIKGDLMYAIYEYRIEIYRTYIKCMKFNVEVDNLNY